MYLFTMQVGITVKRHFPEFLELLGQVSDHRKRPVYKVEELLMVVVEMFLFKRDSRNHADNSTVKATIRAILNACSVADSQTSTKPTALLKN